MTIAVSVSVLSTRLARAARHSREQFRKAAAEAIEQSAKTQARLIEDLLDVSRLVLGKLQLQKSPVLLERVIAQAADMTRPAADAKKIAMEIDVASRIVVDADHIHAIVTVDDDGEGISSDLLPHLFDPFRQGEGAALKGGLGLGLAIARELVNAHAGTGLGSSFIVRLPRAPAGPEHRSGG